MKDTPSNSGYTSHTEVDKPELHFGLSHNTQRMATLGGEVRLRRSARTNTVHVACPKHKTVALITTHWDALGFRLAQLAHAFTLSQLGLARRGLCVRVHN